MTTAERDSQHYPDVLLLVDLDYTTAVLEDWALDESAIRHIHRLVAARLDKGHVDTIIADLILDAAAECQENTPTGEPLS